MMAASSRARLALLVAWMAAASLVVLAGAQVASARVPACAASALSPVYLNTTAGAGSRDAEYGFENRGPGACALSGYPNVRLQTGSGAPLATTEHHAVGAYGITVKPVELAHGAVAYFGIHYAAQTGYGSLRCPTSSALALTPPGLDHAYLLHGTGGELQAYGGSTVHLECGLLFVSALAAKRFQ